MSAIQFGLLGLSVGGLYALVAIGIVLIYRGSRVINLGQGAIGMATTYLFWSLHDNDGFGFAIAATISLLAAALFGISFQLLVMRPLQNRSPLTRMLATLGVAIGFTSVVTLKWPSQLQFVTESLPSRSISLGGGIRLGEDRAIIFGIVVVLCGVLYLVYRWTRFGLATTAVTEHPLGVSTLGYSPNAIAAINWALGCALAGLAGILLAPITGLSVQGMTELAIPAFAACVIGNFASFPITLCAGLGLGVLQSEMSRYLGSTSGWSDALPFFIMLVFLALRGTSLPGKSEGALKLPKVGTGRIRPWAVAVFAAACLAIAETAHVNWVIGLAATLSAGVVVLSYVVVTGYAGQLSLAQFSMAGLGGWMAARLFAGWHLPFLAAFVLAMALAVPIGVVVGLPALRTRGANLAIATLGMGVAIYSLVLNQIALTGGDLGYNLSGASVFGLHVNGTLNPRSYAVLVIVVFVVLALGIANLRRGKSGRRLLAVRSNERAAASLGIGVMPTKLYAFGVSSVVAAAGGVLLAFSSWYGTFAAFDPVTAINYVGYAVIGGVGYLSGSVFGSLLSPGSIANNVASLLFFSTLSKYLALIAGVSLLTIVIVNPNGIAEKEVQRWQKNLRRISARVGAKSTAGTAVSARSHAPVRPEPDRRAVVVGVPQFANPRVLRTEGVSVAFQGVQALADVDFEVRSGEVVGLIGPNGAGKTTFIDAVTGFNSIRDGRIELDGTDITALSPKSRSQLGIGRSFQSLELFEDLTVQENLQVASEETVWWRWLTDVVRPGRPEMGQAMAGAINRFRLDGYLDRRPDELSHGTRRLTAIARSVSRSPAFLFLDEPAAGLSDQERSELVMLIRELARDSEVGVVLIEHDVELVMQACDRVVALDFGRVIAEGPPSEIRTNPLVINAYLGVGDARRASTEDGLITEDMPT